MIHNIYIEGKKWAAIRILHQDIFYRTYAQNESTKTHNGCVNWSSVYNCGSARDEEEELGTERSIVVYSHYVATTESSQ